MEIKSKYETLPLYIDFPEKKIDIFTPCDANHYRDQSLEEVLQKSIQFSIDNNCRVVIMKTMECYDRH